MQEENFVIWNSHADTNICGREPTASEEEKKLAADRSLELSAKVNQFILRRTNTLLSNHLPPKIVEVVCCCKLTTFQSQLYNHFIHSKDVKRAVTEETKQAKILAYITALKKLCNHPKLIYDTIKSGSPGTAGFEDCIHFFPPEMFSGRSGSWTGGDGAAGFEDCIHFFPPEMFSGRSGSWTGGDGAWVAFWKNACICQTTCSATMEN